MAHVHPGDFHRLWLSGVHVPELETLTALQRELPDDYTIFHGLHWTREFRAGTAFGEIDFLIVNRGGALLLVEQKNGSVENTDEGLIKHYSGTAKSIGAQIQRSIDGVRDKYQRQHHDGPPLTLDYLLYCPDCRLTSISDLALSAERVVDAASKGGLSAAVERCLGRGTQDKIRHRRILDFLKGQLELAPDVHAQIGAEERQFERLNGQLLKVVQNLELPGRRLRIRGVAGCGKTQVAAYVCEQAVARRQRTLVLCFNRPLREHLQAALPADAMVQTWYGFCVEFLKTRGEAINFSRGTPPEFWEDVHGRVIAERVPDDWCFDTVIVDEGQDFERRWFEILSLFLKDDGELLWLEDPSQNVRDADPLGESDPPFATYHARENFRSPALIARFIQNVLPFEFESVSALPGLPVRVETYVDPDEQLKLADGAVAEFRRQGFEPHEIVVLSCHGVGRSPLWEASRIAGLPIRRFTGEYDAATTEQRFTDGSLLLESVYRYKGRQAPAVVLCDVDGPASEDRTSQYQQLLYTGMTRATVALTILTSSQWDGSARLVEAAR